MEPLHFALSEACQQVPDKPCWGYLIGRPPARRQPQHSQCLRHHSARDPELLRQFSRGFVSQRMIAPLAIDKLLQTPGLLTAVEAPQLIVNHLLYHHFVQELPAIVAVIMDADGAIIGI